MVILFRKLSKRIDRLEQENIKLVEQNKMLDSINSSNNEEIRKLKEILVSLKAELDEKYKLLDELKLEVQNLKDDGVSPQQLIREYLLGEEGGSKWRSKNN